MAIFVGQGATKSRYLKIFKSQYLSELLRYGPDFLHVFFAIINNHTKFCVNLKTFRYIFRRGHFDRI